MLTSLVPIMKQHDVRVDHADRAIDERRDPLSSTARVDRVAGVAFVISRERLAGYGGGPVYVSADERDELTAVDGRLEHGTR